MAAESRQAPFDGPWVKRAKGMDEWLQQHKVVASATTASLVSTFTGFPLDSLKSRLQSSRENFPLHRLASEVIREEGVGGLWRGFPLPLLTISIVRTVSFTIYTSTKRILNSEPDLTGGTASLINPATPSSSSSRAQTPWVDVHLGVFNRDTAADVATTSMIAGGASGAVVCIGSAPFELVKVRRQLEYQIYRESHPAAFPQAPAHVPPPNLSLSHHPSGTSASPSTHLPDVAKPIAGPSTVPRPPPFVPPTTLQAVRMIIDTAGPGGLYTGWRLHFLRDTLGTALYFAEYDVMRWFLGRKRVSYGPGKGKGRDEEQGDVPEWARSWLPKGLIPFMCGSVAGVTSWAVIYPVDAIKTKAQLRALSGLPRRTPLHQFLRMVRGPDKDNPKPLITGIARLYRGLGVSMARSMLTHGLLWTIVDLASGYIDTRPCERLAESWSA
ncbi:mitochondrial carrier domain-containing protein [Kockovaella imperatae]|uniref:Mitochondrial carrier domain-containing protein n=1 Tax=Kockovaella imperatae TaxID=4999 RepID=A0A1Y1UJU0_9TREE|nr:mitochondrial carrier domain-containing protein [Kockovaella imperatae]ORX38252.1 mitochondrial carrier domain-containing protein [Kockovaella imperatae]